MPYITVTKKTGPAELANDQRNKWTNITSSDKGYWQTDVKNNICLEIFHEAENKFKWTLYDAKSPDPDLAVMSDHKPTLAEALAAVYDFQDGYTPYK